jgi:Domain of unknown function (DUF4389)
VTSAEEPYPARLDARLDEPLNRWLWLVKWFLAIPHWIILAFLWLAFVLTSIAAWFAIVFTGRYPRGIFDFNLGVMRWSWRVGYYATTGIGTDRYPPFSLGPEPDYPATLDVEYPAQLSHWKPFLKWLLLFPQWFIVAAFAGGWGGWHRGPGWPGAIDALTLVVGMILLVKQRYPGNLHGLIIGMARWVFRVGVYLALMRDEYPPFRLEP